MPEGNCTCRILLANELQSYILCGGVSTTKIRSKLFHHIVPLNQDLTGDYEDSAQFPHKGYLEGEGMCAPHV